MLRALNVDGVAELTSSRPDGIIRPPEPDDPDTPSVGMVLPGPVGRADGSRSPPSAEKNTGDVVREVRQQLVDATKSGTMTARYNPAVSTGESDVRRVPGPDGCRVAW